MKDLEDDLSLVEKARVVELITKLAMIQDGLGEKEYAKQSHLFAIQCLYCWFPHDDESSPYPSKLPTIESLLSEERLDFYTPDATATFVAYAEFCEKEREYKYA